MPTQARIEQTDQWRALAQHHRAVRRVHLRDLFASEPDRGNSFRAEGAGLSVDYSKNRVIAETIRLLVALAERSGLRDRTDAMFCGERINVTENRAVLHVRAAGAARGLDRGRRRQCRAGGARRP